MPREWKSESAAPSTNRRALKSNQRNADAEYILEEILYRKNWGYFVRDEIASYLKLIEKDAARGGKLNETKRGRKNR